MTMAALVSSTFLVNALWVVVALILLTAVFTARLIVRPGRAHIWSTPKALGLEYEDVTFTAQDGATLVGWFLPAPAQVRRPAPVIMVVHPQNKQSFSQKGRCKYRESGAGDDS